MENFRFVTDGEDVLVTSSQSRLMEYSRHVFLNYKSLSLEEDVRDDC